MNEGPLYIKQTLTVMIIILNDRVCLHVLDGAGKEYRSGAGREGRVTKTADLKRGRFHLLFFFAGRQPFFIN